MIQFSIKSFSREEDMNNIVSKCLLGIFFLLFTSSFSFAKEQKTVIEKFIQAMCLGDEKIAYALIDDISRAKIEKFRFSSQTIFGTKLGTPCNIKKIQFKEITPKDLLFIAVIRGKDYRNNPVTTKFTGVIEKRITGWKVLLNTIQVKIRNPAKERKGKILGVKVQLKNLKQSIRLYSLHNNQYPKKLEDLIKKPPSAPKWKGPYIDSSKEFIDAWGTPIRYETYLKGFKLISAGPDKKFGTSDDIVEEYRRK